MKKVAVGSDHGGYGMKETVVSVLEELGVEVIDVGCFSTESVDYPDFADLVCQKVDAGECEGGILLCGTGIGMSMAANRHRTIRAALCHEHYTARMSREHNNANVLCMGARVLGTEIAREVVRAWVTTGFAGGRHQRRLAKLG